MKERIQYFLEIQDSLKIPFPKRNYKQIFYLLIFTYKLYYNKDKKI